MTTQKSLLHEIQEVASLHQLWSSGDTIVVAVSGGPDSMALLHLLGRLRETAQLHLIVAHVNHGFRKQESAEEQKMVSAYAQSLGIEVRVELLDMPAYIMETKTNAQAAARDLRYRFLHRVAAEVGATSIALAHHADDQSETVLMRLLRGTGIAGLGGIQIKRAQKNVQLIRPLLRMNKIALVDYCQEQGIPYALDSSNTDAHYWRNQIRLDILPYLQRTSPQLPKALQRLADVASAEDEWMEEQTVLAFERLVTRQSGGYALHVDDLQSLHIALQRRLIKLILSYLAIAPDKLVFEQIESMRRAIMQDAKATWQMDVGSNIRFFREYEIVRWSQVDTEIAVYADCEEPREEMQVVQEHHLSVPQLLTGNPLFVSAAEPQLIKLQSGWRFMFSYGTMQDKLTLGEDLSQAECSTYQAQFDASELTFPLVIRGRKPGDRMHVLGLGGTKKVQDMFVDSKIASAWRGLYPLLIDGSGRLLWIPGVRRSSHALVSKNTQELLFIHIKHT